MAEEPGETVPGPQEPPEPQGPHRDDGLELARALTRAIAKSTPAARKRLKRRTSRTGESRLSGSHPDDRDPQLLGSEVGRLVDQHGWGLDLQVRGVFARWNEVVGEEIGAHSTPETLTDGTLVVRTDSTAWATQLKLLAPALVKRLNTELGDGTVTVVEVVGPNAPSWKHGGRGVRGGRGPRDTYG